MYPGVLWTSVKDLLFREPTLATHGSPAFKRAAQFRPISYAMLQSSIYSQAKNVHSPIRLPREIQTFPFSVFT